MCIVHVCLDTIQINIFQAIESTISWLMTVPICRSLTKAIVTKWSATKRWSEQIVPRADVFFDFDFSEHLMILYLFLTLHTGIALYGGPLQTNACSRSTSVIKDLPVLHCSITTKIQQVPMIQIVSTLLKPIRQKYPPAPSPSDADPPKMGHTDGQSHHPRWSIFLRHRSDPW